MSVFNAQNLDPEWRERRRSPGRYVSTGWIPGNFLAEGAFAVGVGMTSLEPETHHLDTNDAVLFQVVDNYDSSDTARGDYQRPMPGIVRPLLQWTTEFTPLAEHRKPVVH